MNIVKRGERHFLRKVLFVSQRSVIFISRCTVTILQASITRCWETEFGDITGDKY